MAEDTLNVYGLCNGWVGFPASAQVVDDTVSGYVADAFVASRAYHGVQMCVFVIHFVLRGIQKVQSNNTVYQKRKNIFSGTSSLRLNCSTVPIWYS